MSEAIEIELIPLLRQYADVADAGGKPHWATAMRRAVGALTAAESALAAAQAERAALASVVDLLHESLPQAQCTGDLPGVVDEVIAERDAARAECERLRAAAMRVELLESALRHIGDFAHARSTGPTVPDALWAVWGMAYAELP